MLILFHLLFDAHHIDPIQIAYTIYCQ